MKIKKLDDNGFSHVELLIAILVVVVIVGIGGYVYQSHADTQYLSKVKPLYKTQAAQMSVVYASFNRPVFSNNNSTTTQDTSDLAYIDSAIKQTEADTSSLKTTNSIIIIPGLSVLGTVNKTNNEYQAMKTYVKNSDDFLANYMTLSKYVTQLEAIQNTQLGTFFRDLTAASNDSNPAQLSTDAQNASTDLSTTIAALKNLKPNVDVSSLNSKMINAFSNVNTDLQSIVTAIKNQDSQALLKAGNKVATDSASLQSTASTNIDQTLQGNSSIQKQIKALKAENPLYN